MRSKKLTKSIEVIVDAGECRRILAPQMWVAVVPEMMFAERSFIGREVFS